ncbi:hypothetical protein [Clostridium saccharobutylicum]|uniref:Uncharacterized protein n=1 Tax=Clostridium saccharobutylicum DSM 13864 TaxID=1345695 RepID=U5ML78_CLOSA|nr:hypothetical protein [Clostridium saccharobutylicum]AGX41360.1 hypothetical protein CLSA_c03080 [Clostridium saccharobutylicum DSM 13864]AQR88643.1 hypothetical protein CLOSC_03050 [Clostridium saccharobutylicum]AQR98541.1 hypothetical protein CSACC_03050 [Clostridium saccharobutylicum]AQS08253.1 hypothetical protein CLOBY_03230 [Clostridium saccharobutylicum]AQS12531.1 hypothetical protein CLOSACC_03050 [Clostridium saccharobutylicum]
MDYILIICKSGVMYSGQLLQEYSDDLKWVAIKPSTKSNICLYFAADRIKKIYFQDGTSETKIETDLKEIPELDLEIPEENISLIRVKGGISYRGERISKEDISTEIHYTEGYWISPSSIKETIIYIPEYEVEEVYSI